MISKTSPPDVSVVMATYNGARFLEEQLQSILSQTLKPAEIIVCDDQSTDGTRAILENYREKGLLKYFINPERLGVVDNFKRAVSLTAPGNYISLSDQDDIWLPQKLELSVKMLYEIEENNQPCLVYSDLTLVDTVGKIINSSFRNELGQDGYTHELKTLLFGNFVNGCTVVMNDVVKDYFECVPSNYRLNHDYWIALSAFTFGKAKCIKTPLLRYRKHSDNTTEVSTFTKQKRLIRLWQEINTALKEDRFLREELFCVQQFYQTFKLSMNRQQLQIFESFLQLQDKSYLRRKVTATLTLRGLL